MKSVEVYNLLEQHKNVRGIENWKKNNYGNLESFGIGLTQLKVIAKKIGKNHDLAIDLWKEPNYDVKTISILIEEPKKVDIIQVELMVNDANMWMLCHTWVQNLFCKVSFSFDISEEWRMSVVDIKRRVGYAFLYYLARDKKVLDAYFIPILNVIEKEIQQEENFVKDAMNNALFSIGQRSKFLNNRCIEIARNVGKIEVNYGDNSCEAVNVIKHLTSKRMQNKFN